MAGSRIAVRVEDLWKTYRIHPPGARARWLQRPSVDFHALRDVNLEVEEGTVLGVIGRNGAGKSTLLKILSRITDPTRGRVTVYGRVASLLEVGTGFHPELTGRENVYLNAAIHGMKRRDVTTRLPAIIDFAQIGDFLDEPVKRYSSGMYLRLAFSIAAHLEPDILIVDEVLAVGDAEFRERCLGRLGALERAGRTIILVTHDYSIVRTHCQRAVWLDMGQITSNGVPSEVLARQSIGPGTGSARWLPMGSSREPVTIDEVATLSSDGREGTSELLPHEPFCIVIRHSVHQTAIHGRLAIRVSTADGSHVFSSADTDGGGTLGRSFLPGKWEAICQVPGHLLVPGTYSVSIAYPAADGPAPICESVISFRIGHEKSLVSRDGRLGAVAPLLQWRTRARTDPLNP
jgi:lipopolysaccharide transport system ATP-binding protein